MVGVRRLRIDAEVTIGDAHTENGRAAGDGAADAAVAEHAQRLAVEAAPERQRALGPGPGPHEGVALDDAPEDRQDQREGHVGHVLGQHIRRIGDPHPARPRAVEVDRVEPDAETGNDLEFRAGVDKLRVRAEHAVRRDGADAGADLAQEPRPVPGEPQFVDDIVAFERRHLPVGIGADHQHVRLRYEPLAPSQAKLAGRTSLSAAKPDFWQPKLAQAWGCGKFPLARGGERVPFELSFLGSIGGQ